MTSWVVRLSGNTWAVSKSVSVCTYKGKRIKCNPRFGCPSVIIRRLIFFIPSFSNFMNSGDLNEDHILDSSDFLPFLRALWGATLAWDCTCEDLGGGGVVTNSDLFLFDVYEAG